MSKSRIQRKLKSQEDFENLQQELIKLTKKMMRNNNVKNVKNLTDSNNFENI